MLRSMKPLRCPVDLIKSPSGCNLKINHPQAGNIELILDTGVARDLASSILRLTSPEALQPPRRNDAALPVRLKDVTMIGIDTSNHELTELAMIQSRSRAIFGGEILFSDRPSRYGEFVECAPFKSMQEHDLVYWTVAVPRAKTSHVLIVQWDSWILDSSMWNPEFMEYDFIGAPWWFDDNRNVGNGGFSLISTRLGRYLRDNAKRFPITVPADDLICRTYRPALEKHGFKWAPDRLAETFSFENIVPPDGHRTFGFHGLMNWPLVLTAAEIRQRAIYFGEYIRAKEAFSQFATKYHGIFGELI